VTRIAGQGRTGLALSRQTLEQVLVAVLTARGGSLRWRTRATAARADGGVWRVTCRSGGDEWEAPASLVVIADGRFSSLSGRGRRRTARGWFGWNTTFEGVDAAPGSLTLHFCQAGYVGTLTFADGLTNVCGLTWLDARVVSWEDVLAGAMAERRPLGRLLAPAARQAPFRAVGPLPFSGGMWRGNGPLLAGDAAAVTDPFLGEGISRALGTGPLLSAALAATNRADGRGTLGTLGTHYNRLWRSRYHPRLRLGFAARWLVAHPALLGQVLGRVGTRSRAFQRVLALAHGRGR